MDMIKQNNNKARVQPAACCCMAKTDSSAATFNFWATFSFIDPLSQILLFLCSLLGLSMQADELHPPGRFRSLAH